jgi:hypothetical protein
MGLNLTLEALTVPIGAPFPGTMQTFLNYIVQYLSIDGQASFNGVNYGPTTPATADQDKPWFKTDGSYNPLGWYGWNGSAWTPIPMIAPSGGTATRPASPIAEQLYFDTDINCLLIYERSAWRTASGSPGDVKMVKAATIAAALTQNPGWIQDPDSLGRVIGAAGSGAGLTARSYLGTAGQETITLAKENMPTDAVPLKTGWDVFPGQFQNGSQAAGVYPITTGLGTTNSTGAYGSATPISTMGPVVFYWALLKS